MYVRRQDIVLTFIDRHVSFSNFTIPNLIPRFLHIKPKAKPEEIDAFKTGQSSARVQCLILTTRLILVLPSDYYASITMGLNRTRTVPNSTSVWWEMSEYDNKYLYTPSDRKSVV